MTTLILLCLALVGAGVFLFAPQVRAQIVGGLSLKLLCLVVVGCMILPASQVRAELRNVQEGEQVSATEKSLVSVCVNHGGAGKVVMIAWPPQDGVFPRPNPSLLDDALNSIIETVIEASEKPNYGAFGDVKGVSYDFAWVAIVTAYLHGGFRLIDQDFLLPYDLGGRKWDKCYLLQKQQELPR